MKKILLIAFALTWFNTAKAQNEPENRIFTLVQNMEIAWASKNASQFAANFAEEHDYIVWNGMYSPNITVEANKNGHEFLFSELEKKTNIKYVIDKINYLTEDIAVVHVLGCTYKKDSHPLPYPTQIQTWIVQNKDQSWKIKSMHSSDIEYDVFIHEESCPDIPSTEDQKTAYAMEYYKSYYVSSIQH